MSMFPLVKFNLGPFKSVMYSFISDMSISAAQPNGHLRFCVWKYKQPGAEKMTQSVKGLLRKNWEPQFRSPEPLQNLNMVACIYNLSTGAMWTGGCPELVSAVSELQAQWQTVSKNEAGVIEDKCLAHTYVHTHTRTHMYVHTQAHINITYALNKYISKASTNWYCSVIIPGWRIKNRKLIDSRPAWAAEPGTAWYFQSYQSSRTLDPGVFCSPPHKKEMELCALSFLSFLHSLIALISAITFLTLCLLPHIFRFYLGSWAP